MTVMPTIFDDWQDMGRDYHVSIRDGIDMQSILCIGAINK